jgi:hypothetical protein
MKWEKPAGLITKALGFGEDVSGFKYGERYNGMFPDGGYKIQKDAWNLYKEGYSEDEIVDEMLTQEWYQKFINSKHGNEQELRDYVKDYVISKAHSINWGKKWDEDPEFRKKHSGVTRISPTDTTI